MKTNDSTPAREGAGGWEAERSVSAFILDLCVCSVLVAIGLWFIVDAMTLRAGRSWITPATFPTYSGGLLIALSLLQIFLSARRRSTEWLVTFQRPLSVAICIALMLLLPPAVDSFGFYPVIAVWAIAFGWIAGIRRLIPLAVTLAIILFVARVIFEMVLGTPLP